MRRIFILISLFVAMFLVTGCGPGGTALFVLLSTQKGEKKKVKPPFSLTVDNLIVQGTVTDNLDNSPKLRINSTNITVIGSAFTADFSTTHTRNFLFEATDHAVNTTELHLRVE
jgi:hypothetical protein